MYCINECFQQVHDEVDVMHETIEQMAQIN